MDAPNEIGQRARFDLTIETPDRGPDLFIWERAERVARTAIAVTELVGIATSEADQTVVVAAALYQDACWVTQYQEEEITHADILAKPLTTLQRELSGARVRESLADVLSVRRIEAICRAIRAAGERRTSNVAAQVVAEATNLERVGQLALCQMIHRHLQQGRSLRALLETWDRQQEYNFWPARIREGFRFEAVRRIAQQRLEAMESFMASFRCHLRAEDVIGSRRPMGSETLQPDREPT